MLYAQRVALPSQSVTTAGDGYPQALRRRSVTDFKLTVNSYIQIMFQLFSFLHLCHSVLLVLQPVKPQSCTKAALIICSFMFVHIERIHGLIKRTNVQMFAEVI
jgi:hypothetical protein